MKSCAQPYNRSTSTDETNNYVIDSCLPYNSQTIRSVRKIYLEATHGSQDFQETELFAITRKKHSLEGHCRRQSDLPQS